MKRITKIFSRFLIAIVVITVICGFSQKPQGPEELEWDVYTDGEFSLSYPVSRVKKGRGRDALRAITRNCQLNVYKFTNQPSFKAFVDFIIGIYEKDRNITVMHKEIVDFVADIELKIKKNKKVIVRAVPCGVNTIYVVQMGCSEEKFIQEQETIERVINSVQCALSLQTGIASLKDVGYRIIFESVRDAPLASDDYNANPHKYFELYTMNADGTDIKRITDNSWRETQAEVSPDGEKILCTIAFTSDKVHELDSGWEIAVMDIDGKNLKKLTNNNYFEKGPDWNHDGTEIVYIADSAHRTNEDIKNRHPFQLDLYVMGADGSQKKQLTFAEAGEIYADPSFSNKEPSRIAYVHSQGFTDKTDLYIMDAEGKNKKPVLMHTKEIQGITDPVFFPNDKRIIFMGRLNKRQKYEFPIYNIFSINVDGSDLKSITSYDGESDALPNFSPDGTRISYYTYSREGDITTHRIRIANPDGSDEKIVSSFLWDAAPSWVPKGDLK